MIGVADYSAAVFEPLATPLSQLLELLLLPGSNSLAQLTQFRMRGFARTFLDRLSCVGMVVLVFFKEFSL
jgi:hypothetical protein